MIILFLASVMFISPAFAQLGGIDYDIRGGEVLGFEVDTETTSIVISLDPRLKGELVITLPRSIIDAKIDSDDTDFEILVGGLNLNFYDETTTSSDRTLTIPFGKSDYDIIITGTQLFSQVTTPTKLLPMEKMIQDELELEMPENQAKLLVFSDTQWSGALQSSSFDFTEINDSGNSDVLFTCESSLTREGIFGAKIEKTTQDGYLTLVVIQNQTIVSQGTTTEPFGEVLINGSCVSDFESSGGGGCLIATATFGSELAPQVQQLREIRDHKLLQTESGRSFMESFNEFYYSFSPVIADYERENPIFREVVKIAITPMVSSLSILNYVDMSSEVKVIGYGISLILLNGLMYVGVPIGAIIVVRRIQTLTHLDAKQNNYQ